MQSINHPRQEPTPPNETATASRLRTVTGNRFPRKCACGCGFAIPRDPEVRYVVDFGAAKPFPAYLWEHSPVCGTLRGVRPPQVQAELWPVPGFQSGSQALHVNGMT